MRPLVPCHHSTLVFFCFTAPPTTAIYTLSLHDALPISATHGPTHFVEVDGVAHRVSRDEGGVLRSPAPALVVASPVRSEEHTSELQSRRDLVCRLLLEKKKTKDSAQRTSYRQ